MEGMGWLLRRRGEIWVKLDAGSEKWHQKVNASKKITLNTIEKNIITAGRKFPLAIQTLFLKIREEVPSEKEIHLYIERLHRIINSGADIREIQLYTILRPPAKPYCRPVTRRFLNKTGRRITDATGIPVKVYY